jgi:SAM-dependent methyltransferase
MTGDVDLFGALHAAYYDRFHQNKDYAAEVDQIRDVLDHQGPAEGIIDLGCGTGRHLELLAASGHRVVGVDKSAAMAERAGKRLARYGSLARVVHSDLVDLAHGSDFDAAIMMFSLIGYQVSNRALLAALAAALGQVRRGGLFLFDYIDAAAVLGGRSPTDGFAVIPDGDSRLVCAYATSADLEAQLVDLRLRLWLVQDNRLVDQVEEQHRIRFFLPRELDFLLQVAGFALLGTAPLAGATPGPSPDWFRLAWARRVR